MPPFPVLKAGHSVSYSYICLEWVNGWVSYKIPVWLVCYTHGFCALCSCVDLSFCCVALSHEVISHV